MVTCVICNRKLSNPDSIRQGIGPVCWARLKVRAETEDMDMLDGFLDLELYPIDESVVLIRDAHGPKTNVPRLVTHHSPTGYEWGYGGSGPADLALNICEYYLRVLRSEGYDIGDLRECFDGVVHSATLGVYQRFKGEFIASIDESGGEIKANEIIHWLKMHIPHQKQLF